MSNDMEHNKCLFQRLPAARFLVVLTPRAKEPKDVQHRRKNKEREEKLKEKNEGNL